MWIKNYTASSVREALARIKDEMGAGAVILDTRVENGLTRRSSGSGARVTVTAAVDRGAEQTASSELQPPVVSEGPRTLRLRGELAEKPTEEEDVRAVSEPEHGERMSNLTTRVTELERGVVSLLERLDRRAVTVRPDGWLATPETQLWLNTQQRLKTELADAYVGFLLDQVPEPDPFLSHDRLPTAVCFVGPPGCGTSTMLMKALALWWRTRQRSFPVVEIVGDQVPSGGRLAAWAGMFDIEWRRFGFDETGRISRFLSDLRSESVFVRCELPSAEEGGERAARKVMRVLEARLTALVLSSLVRRTDNERLMERYAVFQPTHLCFSHWDEAATYDDARHLSVVSRLPLAYRTAGPAPCDQIEPFTNSDLRAGVAAEIADHAQTGPEATPAEAKRSPGARRRDRRDSEPGAKKTATQIV